MPPQWHLNLTINRYRCMICRETISLENLCHFALLYGLSFRLLVLMLDCWVDDLKIGST